jgi:hypothetical protein
MPDRYIRVLAQAEGTHRWPGAPDGERYLRQPHRHLFTAEVRVQVSHGDREIEINAFTRWMNTEVLPDLATPAAPGEAPDFGSQSCEQLAERIAVAIRDEYGPGRWIECEVLEDGILGGGVRWPG